MTRPRLAVATRAATDPAADALRALAVALAPHLREVLAGERRDETLVDLAREIPASRRTLYRAARAGEIAGAVRVGRRWLAPRASVDAWLRVCGPRPVPTPAADDGDADELDAIRESLARPDRAPRRRRAVST